jgi:ubiquinone/menaquinone biosynthesis C-methylase UbiE
MKTQYDNIAEQYRLARNTIVERHVNEPTFLKLIGDLKGKNVLDLACGSGAYTRQIKNLGASRVVGVDESFNQLKIARFIEEVAPQGIEYFQYDVTELKARFKFDVVTGVFLLHYADTRENLQAMCQNIYGGLIPGGRFVGVNGFSASRAGMEYPNPDPKYGVLVEPAFPKKEGTMRTVTLVNEDKRVSFDQWYWLQDTYEKALVDVGFKDVKFHDAVPDAKGIEKFGKDFWDNYYKSPTSIGITAVKLKGARK